MALRTPAPASGRAGPWCALLLAALLVCGACGRGSGPGDSVAESVRRVQRVVDAMRAWRARHPQEAWPTLSGRAFILSFVVSGDLRIDTPDDVRVLFGAGRPIPATATVERYRSLRPAELQGSDLSDLCGLWGRRNADREHLLTADQLQKATPLVADVTLPAHVVVGWSNGSTRAVPSSTVAAGEPTLRDLKELLRGSLGPD